MFIIVYVTLALLFSAASPSIRLISPFLHHHFTLIKISCMVVCATNIVGISVYKLGLNSIRSIAHFV